MVSLCSGYPCFFLRNHFIGKPITVFKYFDNCRHQIKNSSSILIFWHCHLFHNLTSYNFVWHNIIVDSYLLLGQLLKCLFVKKLCIGLLYTYLLPTYIYYPNLKTSTIINV